MSTTFAPLLSAAAVCPTSTDPVDVRLAACGAVVCVADTSNGLPWSRHSRSYNGRTCCSSSNLFF